MFSRLPHYWFWLHSRAAALLIGKLAPRRANGASDSEHERATLSEIFGQR